MKTSILLTVLIIGMIECTVAQKPSITITFTADDNGQHLSLDSILIMNLTQGGDTTLYSPDTVVVLNYNMGLKEVSDFSNGFSLFQNYPNPIEGKTIVSLWLPDRHDILITISDVIGREVVNQEFHLEQGDHTFTFYPGRESLYFLTARADQQSQTIKMFNSPGIAAVSGLCTLEYNGAKNGLGSYKAGILLNNFVFDPGDQLQYTATSALGNRTIIDTPSGNQAYTFLFGSGGMPCPNMPTVTDIDGNVYNTVLIGNQCWMKENLKTTTYRNGTSIPNVIDTTAWLNLTTGAYVWYDNDISWKDKYGALYNWFTAIDSNGLCPLGWHVPPQEDWDVLFGLIGNLNQPIFNVLKSCRQVNSTLGGSCNTNNHPRWDAEVDDYGTDDYGFAGLPGGRRHSHGPFSLLGSHGFWWTSTLDTLNMAWLEYLYGASGFIYIAVTNNKEAGFSVRCLRDN
jgi:uncharacterized protein (TIGR02145 family)